MHTVWIRTLIMTPAPTDMLIHTLVPHTMQTTEHKPSYPNYRAQARIYVLHAKMLIGSSTKAYTDLHMCENMSAQSACHQLAQHARAHAYMHAGSTPTATAMCGELQESQRVEHYMAAQHLVVFVLRVLQRSDCLQEGTYRGRKGQNGSS